MKALCKMAIIFGLIFLVSGIIFPWIVSTDKLSSHLIIICASITLILSAIFITALIKSTLNTLRDLFEKESDNEF